MKVKATEAKKVINRFVDKCYPNYKSLLNVLVLQFRTNPSEYNTLCTSKILWGGNKISCLLVLSLGMWVAKITPSTYFLQKSVEDLFICVI